MKCRVCESVLGEKIFALPAMPLTDEFVSTSFATDEFIRDICIYQCINCGLVQNPVDFDHKGYYENYEYSSGHSDFTRAFMRSYAQSICDAFRSVHGHSPKSVLEIGSGDGEQLRAFQQLGVHNVFGVEPSQALVRQSKKLGVSAYKGFFSSKIINELEVNNFDVCISSYTLDHVRDPLDYLRAAHTLLVPGGVLAFEVHDLSRIAERGEWCLFEHEHTIYMDAEMAEKVLSSNGFKVFSINPIPESEVRANSLIVIAHKTQNKQREFRNSLIDYSGLQSRVDAIIDRIDAWIDALQPGARLVGYGAGGRGVMTLAALGNASRFETLFDSNHSSGQHCTPKTRISISGLEALSNFNNAWCLVFSFGYMSEISFTLQAAGFRSDRIVSLRTFLD